MTLLLYCLLSLIFCAHTHMCKSADQRTVENRLKEAASKDPFKYFSDKDRETLISCELAYIKGDTEYLEEKLLDKSITIEDLGLMAIGNARDEEVNKESINFVAKKDPYATWKAYKKMCQEAKDHAPFSHPASETNLGHLRISLVKTLFDLGFVIPLKRYEIDLKDDHFKYQYIPMLHYLASPQPNEVNTYCEEIDTLFQDYLKKGANPYYKANCSILIDNIEEKSTPVDVLTVLTRNKNISDEDRARLINLCQQHVTNPIDTKNQFYPNTSFYKAPELLS